MSWILKRFRKKEEKPVIEEEKPVKSELEEFCGNDQEVYKALFDTMFLDPRKIGTSLEEAVKKASVLEKDGDKLRAAVWYQIAGGLAIYENNVEKVKEYFGKCSELTGKKYLILDIPDKAVKKAQEYYHKYLK